MEVIQDPMLMQSMALAWRREGASVGLVPTMGYLHEGHLSLLRIAREHCDLVVVSLFVNPTQFGPDEDFDRYPQNHERDLRLCEEEGASVVFMPSSSSVYAEDASVFLQEEALSQGLCGLSRPIHFRGVLTVVAKLFNLILPEVAVFGEKDAQQLRLIKRMVRDLNFPVTILPGPIVREDDGVAMSSRNSNLSKPEREQATVLRQTLLGISEKVAKGETDIVMLRTLCHQRMEEASLGELDYLAFVDNETLEPVDKLADRRVLVAMAVQFSNARLIDNIVL